MLDLHQVMVIPADLHYFSSEIYSYKPISLTELLLTQYTPALLVYLTVDA